MFPIRDHNPSGRTPYVTLALIGINVLVFLAFNLALSEPQLMRFVYTWGLVPARVGAGQGLETVITHMFLHGGWMHIIGNLLFLWIFGDNMESEMGHLGFLVFYLASGLAAAGLQFIAEPASTVPMVGASGAIAGVMGGYLLLFPRARVDVLVIFIVFFRIFAFRAWAVLGLWFGMQVFAGLSTPSDQGGVAYWAHIGGFVAGGLLTLPVWRRRGAGAYWQKTEGHPPHPAAQYPLQKTSIPRVGRRR
ncbi:MAG: rhomboid family intramembrane serine protease [Paracoccaceae bacterium]